MAVEIARGELFKSMLGSAHEAEGVRTDPNPPAAVCNVSSSSSSSSSSNGGGYGRSGSGISHIP